MTRETRSLYLLGAHKVKLPLLCNMLENHTGEVTRTRLARCDELDQEGKPLAFSGKGFRT